MRTLANAAIAVFAISIFIAGLYVYTLAFAQDRGIISALIFFGGILLNTVSFLIPWHIVGRSRK